MAAARPASELSAARQRRVGREVAHDAALQRLRQPVPEDRVEQPRLLLRVADEGGLDQDARDVGRLEHRERGLLHARLVQPADAADLAQHVEETVTGVRVVKGFGQESRAVDQLVLDRGLGGDLDGLAGGGKVLGFMVMGA